MVSIHDAVLHANAFVRIRKTPREEEREDGASSARPLLFGSRPVPLPLAGGGLWRACCLAPYFKDGKSRAIFVLLFAEFSTR